MVPIHIDPDKCARDGACIPVCPSQLLGGEPGQVPQVDPMAEVLCIRCGHCVAACPTQAITLSDAQPGRPIPTPAAAPEAFDALLMTRRSIRHYKSDPVPRELIAHLLDVTRWAPSATNVQSVEWLVVYDSNEVRRLAGLVAEGIASVAYFRRMVRAWKKGFDTIFRGAPHLAIAHAKDGPISPATDCAIALTQLDLLAHAHGLGACWAGVLMVALAQSPAVREALALPEGHQAYGALMLGYGDEKYLRIPDRKPVRIAWK